MGNTRRYYWLRLERQFYQRHDIKLLRAENRAYIDVYVSLMCESIDHEGSLRFDDETPYTNEQLAVLLDCDQEFFDACWASLVRLRLVTISKDGTIHVSLVKGRVGSETDSARRMRKHRDDDEHERHIGVTSASQKRTVANRRVTQSNGGVTMQTKNGDIERSAVNGRDDHPESEYKTDESERHIVRKSDANVTQSKSKSKSKREEGAHDIASGWAAELDDDPTPPPPPKKSKAVKTEPKQKADRESARYRRLCDAYGKEIVEDYIRRVEAHEVSGQAKRPYRDYVAAAENWIARDKVEPKPGAKARRFDPDLHPPTCECGGMVKALDGEAICVDCNTEWAWQNGAWERVAHED